MKEARFGESMVRASVDADLGQLLFSAVTDPNYRDRLEEAIVDLAHTMFECGQTEGSGLLKRETGKAYMRGMFDTIGIYESYEGRSDNGDDS